MSVVVSIITPHHDRPELLRQTVESVQRQSFNDWELVIVDDGSASETWLSIQELAGPKVRVVQRTGGPNGPSQCRNLGTVDAKGEYLLFLDSDDLLAEKCLEQRMQQAQTYPDFDLWVFPVELFRDRPGDLKLLWNLMSDDSETLARFLSSDGPWCVSSPIWRKAAFQRVGGFNPLVMYGDDSDLHIRTLLAGTSYRQFPTAQPDVYIRRSQTLRITNRCDFTLLESRRVRLREGFRALNAVNATLRQHETWEGQYFAEGEFLLFTQDHPMPDLTELKRIWVQDYPHSILRRWIAWNYLTISVQLRHPCYLAVRILRRLAMVILPVTWFPDRRS